MANPTLCPPIFRALVLIAGKLVALLIGLGVKVGRGGRGGGRLSFRALGSVGGFRALGSVGFSSSGQREIGREIGGEREREREMGPTTATSAINV
ncbi:unnamed protein product [Prunus armeniaca]|uniref:Uncharacterized protein n=1 Tax=Prunus armeniaca TaxID=36596 RepID=A0A6J5TZ53_PRUAR|nr:unnamed protein product [Prunus armeniaca]